MIRRLIATWTVCLCVSGGPPQLIAQESSSSDLSPLLEQQTFAAADDDKFQGSRQDLLKALRSPAGEIDQEDWDYLRTESVADSLEQGTPELPEWLDNLVAKLNQDYSPYDEPRLLELRRLVRRHLRMIENRESREVLQQEFQDRKASTQDALAAFLDRGRVEDYRRLAEDIRWMQEHDMAPDFVHAAKHRLSYPNFEAKLPASLVQSATSTDLPTQSETINRTSDGIRTVGNGVFTSQAHLKPTDSAGEGDFRLSFSGEFRLSATNTLRKVRFRSNATTWAWATAAIGMDNTGYLSYNGLQVCTRSNLCNGKACVDRRVGKRVVGNLVDRVVAKKTPEVEQTLSKELRERVEKELATQIVELVGKANTAVKERFWAPARRLDLAPRSLSVATSDQQVQIQMLEDTQCGLAAPGSFGGPDSGTGYAAMHTTLLGDLMNSVYVRHKQPSELNGDLVQRLNASLPVQPFAEVNLPEIRLTIALDFPRPFLLDFEDDIVHLTIRAKELVLDDVAHPGRDLTISYRVSAHADNKVHFELQDSPRLSVPKKKDPAATEDLAKAVNDELLAGLLPGFTLDLEDMISSDSEDAGPADEDKSLPIRISGIEARGGWLVFLLSPAVNGGIKLVQN